MNQIQCLCVCLAFISSNNHNKAQSFSIMIWLQYLWRLFCSDFCFVDFFQDTDSGKLSSVGCYAQARPTQTPIWSAGWTGASPTLDRLAFLQLHTVQPTGSPGYSLPDEHHLSLGFFLFYGFRVPWPSFIDQCLLFFSWVHTQNKKWQSILSQNLEVKECTEGKWSKPGCSRGSHLPPMVYEELKMQSKCQILLLWTLDKFSS